MREKRIGSTLESLFDELSESHEFQALIAKKLDSGLSSARYEIKELEQVILGMLPRSLATVVSRYIDEGHLGDLNEVIDAALELAEEIPDAEVLGGMSGRALCPLCRQGPPVPPLCIGQHVCDPYGYRLSEGLVRHLEGYGNFPQCSVIEIAHKRAKARVAAEERTRAQREREDREREADRQRRLKDPKILLYKTGPESTGELLGDYQPHREEGQHERYFRLRTPEGLEAAEHRLRSIGFSRPKRGRVRSYMLAWNDLVVYADPRQDEQILLRAFDGTRLVHAVYVLDSAKKPLLRLEKAVRER